TETAGAAARGDERGGGQRDAVVRLRAGRTDLHVERGAARAEQRLTVEVHRQADPVDLAEDFLVLRVQRGLRRAVVGAGRVGSGLLREGDGALQQARDLTQGAVGDLDDARAVVRVPDRLVERGDVGAETVGDREAGGVVRRRVDPETGGEPLEG